MTGRSYLRGESGAGAVEAAIWLAVLVPVMAAAFDVALYAFESVQVANASQMAAHSTFLACGQSAAAPVSTNCSSFSSALNSGAYSTTLGSGVSASTTDGCLDSSGNFTSTGCGSTGEYLKVVVTYPFHPVFTGNFVTGILGTSISQTTALRMN